MRQLAKRLVLWALGDVAPQGMAYRATAPVESNQRGPADSPLEAPEIKPPFEGGIQTLWRDTPDITSEANAALPEDQRDRPIRQVPRCAPGDHYVTQWPRCFRCGADVTEEKGQTFVRLSMPSAAAVALLPVFSDNLASINASMGKPGADFKEIAARANALTTLRDQVSRQLADLEKRA